MKSSTHKCNVIASLAHNSHYIYTYTYHIRINKMSVHNERKQIFDMSNQNIFKLNAKGTKVKRQFNMLFF